MPKTLAAIYALLIAVNMPALVIGWQHGDTFIATVAAAVIGFIAALAVGVWMNHTIRG